MPITALTTDEHIKTPPTMSQTDCFSLAARRRKTTEEIKKGMAIIVNVFISASV